MRRPFLTAEWRNLALANYAIDPARLRDRIPDGVELDLHDGLCLVSLLAFRFVTTRVRGLAVPGHTDFEEVNLRFYVRRGDRRGVVFIKEIVPRPAIAWVARTLYGEPYETWTCSCQGTDYRWKRGSEEHRFAVVPANEGHLPPPGSHAEFITEHYCGYTRLGPGLTNEYQVTHPQWPHFAVESYAIEVDFAAIYGPEWSDLTGAAPHSVLFAEGSEIAVYHGARINR